MSFKDFAKKSAEIGNPNVPTASNVKPPLAPIREKEAAGPPNKSVPKV
jgi:hypothetical protein